MKESSRMSVDPYSFEKDPYRRQLATRVLSVGVTDGQPYVVLEDTIFYPEGGGQPSDRGMVGEVPIVDVQRIEGEIRHFIERPLEPGPVDLLLDWDRRYDHMQQHTAQHLLSALSLHHLGWETKSFHIGALVSDIEIGAAAVGRKQLAQLEDVVADSIRQCHPIRCRRVDPIAYSELDVRSRGLPADHIGDIRLVEIEAIDLNTCGGTHLQSTAEVEAVKVLRTEPIRGGHRLFWVAGMRLRRRLGVVEKRFAELRRMLDSSEDDATSTLGERLHELKDQKRRIRELESDLAGVLAAHALASDESVVDLHLDSKQVGVLRPIAETLSGTLGTRRALVTADDPPGGRFAVVAGHDFAGDLEESGSEGATHLRGRGGGSRGIYQGKFTDLALRPAALEYCRARLQKV